MDSYTYTYNVGNQRTSVQRAGVGDTNTANYGYDVIGQVLSDTASEGTTNRLNEQLHYGFDPAGNLAFRTNNALIQNFAVNSLNELTSNTNGGTLSISFDQSDMFEEQTSKRPGRNAGTPLPVKFAFILLGLKLGQDVGVILVNLHSGLNYILLELVEVFIINVIPLWFAFLQKNWARWVIVISLLVGVCFSAFVYGRRHQTFSPFGKFWFLLCVVFDVILLAALVHPASNRWFNQNLYEKEKGTNHIVARFDGYGDV